MFKNTRSSRCSHCSDKLIRKAMWPKVHTWEWVFLHLSMFHTVNRTKYSPLSMDIKTAKYVADKYCVSNRNLVQYISWVVMHTASNETFYATSDLRFRWRFGLTVARWLRSTNYSTPGAVTTLMGDCLLTGKPSRYVPSHLGQLSFPSPWGEGEVNLEYSSTGWG